MRIPDMNERLTPVKDENEYKNNEMIWNWFLLRSVFVENFKFEFENDFS